MFAGAGTTLVTPGLAADRRPSRAEPSPSRPTAVFAAGYSYALEVYATAAAAGLKIPQDLSVVGVDDPPSAEHLAPAMTTLRQPLLQLGEDAAVALLERMSEPSGARVSLTNRVVAPELVLRKSAAGPAAPASEVANTPETKPDASTPSTRIPFLTATVIFPPWLVPAWTPDTSSAPPSNARSEAATWMSALLPVTLRG